jgi:hypothetical protein
VATHQAAEARLRDEAVQLRAEKEQWETTRARIETDYATVQKDRVELRQRVDSLMGINAESGRTQAEEMDKLEKRIDELQREA